MRKSRICLNPWSMINNVRIILQIKDDLIIWYGHWPMWPPSIFFLFGVFYFIAKPKKLWSSLCNWQNCWPLRFLCKIIGHRYLICWHIDMFNRSRYWTIIGIVTKNHVNKRMMTFIWRQIQRNSMISIFIQNILLFWNLNTKHKIQCFIEHVTFSNVNVKF